MSDLIDFEAVLAADPSLSVMEGQLVSAAVNSAVRRVAPCVLDTSDPGIRAEALLIVTNAISAAAEAPSRWVDTETAGPFTTKYRSVLEGGVLGIADEAALRALCGSGASVSGLSRASFPEPVGKIDALFGFRFGRR